MKKNFLDLPEGIKILSVLTLIIAFSMILIGLSIAGLYDIASVDQGFLSQQGLPPLASWQYLVFGLITIGVGYLLYRLATRGLNQGRNWAKFTVGVISGIFALLQIKTIVDGRVVSGILMLLVYALIFWYVLFCKETKKFFHN